MRCPFVVFLEYTHWILSFVLSLLFFYSILSFLYHFYRHIALFCLIYCVCQENSEIQECIRGGPAYSELQRPEGVCVKLLTHL